MRAQARGLASRSRGGYILVETIVSMALLSISMYMIYGCMRNAMAAEAQSQDFTVARMILEEVVANLEMPAQLQAHRDQKTFYERFDAVWQVEEVPVPLPELPPGVPPDITKRFEDNYVDYVCKVHVEVSWSRAGAPYKIVGETLLSPSQIFKPEGHAFR